MQPSFLDYIFARPMFWLLCLPLFLLSTMKGETSCYIAGIAFLILCMWILYDDYSKACEETRQERRAAHRRCVISIARTEQSEMIYFHHTSDAEIDEWLKKYDEFTRVPYDWDEKIAGECDVLEWKKEEE